MLLSITYSLIHLKQVQNKNRKEIATPGIGKIPMSKCLDLKINKRIKNKNKKRVKYGCATFDRYVGNGLQL